MSGSMLSAHEAMEDASIKISETTSAAAATVKQSGIVQNYAMPVWSMVRRRYNQSPMVLKISILSFAALSAVPIGCFMGFMGLITLGCMIVGGIAFTVVEGGFAMFGSAFLLPALGLVLLMTGALSLFGLVVWGGYVFTCYVVGIIWGPGEKRDIQRNVERGVDRAQLATTSFSQ
ncbi:hypothetical protein BGZ51_005309 [Haplosporangium sp. Z 767]|nr:hypothetical protein BGZ51_005309 [Haplosporangium sp. Z 767]KAF9189885.1 hypothetical protein BGZ50_000548 [Haplosporangium sp. Z 11]